MSAAEQYAATIRDARAVAHRAVTEGVNLKYVDVLRRTTYELADLAAALLEQQQQRDDQVKELEASAEALARDDDDDPNEWARKFVDNELSWHEHGDDLREGARHLVDALALAVRAERQQAEAEAAYAAELGLRLATERLLDEARQALEFYAEPTTYFGVAILADSSTGGFDEDIDEVPWPDGGTNWKPGKRARAALARLGAAAPQQEPATTGDEPGGSSVAQESDWPGDPLDGLAGSKVADAELEFLSASIAVWEEIDRHIDDDGHYVAGVPESLSPSNELRRRELEAWRRYRDLRWPSGGVSGVNE